MDIARSRHSLVIPTTELRQRIPLRRWVGAVIVVAGLVVGASHLWI